MNQCSYEVKVRSLEEIFKEHKCGDSVEKKVRALIKEMSIKGIMASDYHDLTKDPNYLEQLEEYYNSGIWIELNKF